MAKATLTVVLDDGSSTTREMSWQDGESPRPDDWGWLYADIINSTEESSN